MSGSTGDAVRGRLVTFEGVEGAGKTTQIELLAARLRAAGVETTVTREPGGTELGRKLRQLLLDAADVSIDPVAELLLYAADRLQHIREVIGPALARGAVVLCDRFTDATVAYQGYGRGLGAEVVRALHRLPPLDLRPDRTVLLDVDPAGALARARRRNRERGAAAADRFEAEDLAFHQRVRQGYLELAAAEPDRVLVVPAGDDPARVAARIAARLSDLIPALDGAAP